MRLHRPHWVSQCGEVHLVESAGGRKAGHHLAQAPDHPLPPPRHRQPARSPIAFPGYSRDH